METCNEKNHKKYTHATYFGHLYRRMRCQYAILIIAWQTCLGYKILYTALFCHIFLHKFPTQHHEANFFFEHRHEINSQIISHVSNNRSFLSATNYHHYPLYFVLEKIMWKRGALIIAGMQFTVARLRQLEFRFLRSFLLFYCIILF